MTNAISGSIRTVAPMASTGQGDACTIVGAKIGASEHRARCAWQASTCNRRPAVQEATVMRAWIASPSSLSAGGTLQESAALVCRACVRRAGIARRTHDSDWPSEFSKIQIYLPIDPIQPSRIHSAQTVGVRLSRTSAHAVPLT